MAARSWRRCRPARSARAARPCDGLAFFTSAITPAWPAAILRAQAAARSRASARRGPRRRAQRWAGHAAAARRRLPRALTARMLVEDVAHVGFDGWSCCGDRGRTASSFARARLPLTPTASRARSMPSAIELGHVGRSRAPRPRSAATMSRARARLVGQRARAASLRFLGLPATFSVAVSRPSAGRSPRDGSRTRAPRRRCSSPTSVAAPSEISSMPSLPYTTMACFAPRRCITRTWMPTRSGWNTPIRMVRRVGRVGQRAEDVEDGAHAHFLADRGDVLHRRMVVRREHEADAGLRDARADLLRRADRCSRPAPPARPRCPTWTTRCGCRAWRPSRRPPPRRTSTRWRC